MQAFRVILKEALYAVNPELCHTCTCLSGYLLLKWEVEVIASGEDMHGLGVTAWQRFTPASPNLQMQELPVANCSP